MLRQQVVEPVVTEGPAALIRENGSVGVAVKLFEPAPQGRRRILAQRRTAFLASLAMTTQMGTRAKLNILAEVVPLFRTSA